LKRLQRFTRSGPSGEAGKIKYINSKAHLRGDTGYGMGTSMKRGG
jgi:hypothetical protein